MATPFQIAVDFLAAFVAVVMALGRLSIPITVHARLVNASTPGQSQRSNAPRTKAVTLHPDLGEPDFRRLSPAPPRARRRAPLRLIESGQWSRWLIRGAF
jgi:hypothetical protein